jgi:hypothetical protein
MLRHLVHSLIFLIVSRFSFHLFLSFNTVSVYSGSLLSTMSTHVKHRGMGIVRKHVAGGRRKQRLDILKAKDQAERLTAAFNHRNSIVAGE